MIGVVGLNGAVVVVVEAGAAVEVVAVVVPDPELVEDAGGFGEGLPDPLPVVVPEVVMDGSGTLTKVNAELWLPESGDESLEGGVDTFQSLVPFTQLLESEQSADSLAVLCWRNNNRFRFEGFPPCADVAFACKAHWA